MRLALLTGLTAAALALANPLAPLHRRDDWLTVKSTNYTGTGCPPGSLTGQFWPSSNTFNITIASTKAALETNLTTTNVTCHVAIALRTAAHTQLNILAGDFLGHVYLSAPGVRAAQQNTYSFAHNPGWHQMRWEFEGPADHDTVFANELATAFASPCGGDFVLQIENVLSLERDGGGEGWVELSRLTGSLGHALVLEEKAC